MKLPGLTLMADSLYHDYGRENILSGIYLKLGRGEITGILGRNGCGKTTLFRVLMGITQAKGGIVKVDNVYIPAGKRRQYLALLPQVSCLPKYLKVKEVIRLFRSRRPDNRPEIAAVRNDERIHPLLEQRCRTLSGGEKRYLELLLVLSLKKPFVLLDEPYSELEPLYVTLVNEKIRAAASATGFLVTDHRHHDLRRVVNSLYVMTGNTLHESTNTDQELQNRGYLPGHSL